MSVGTAPNLGGNMTAGPDCADCGGAGGALGFGDYGGRPFRRPFSAPAAVAGQAIVLCPTPPPGVGQPPTVDPVYPPPTLTGTPTCPGGSGPGPVA